MNISTSECSSGCESGWTMYLDQLSNSTYPYPYSYNNCEQGKGVFVMNEDEDLSMVSDASSGPPQYENGGDSHYYYASESSKKKNMQKNNKIKEAKRQQNLCLDDTASSPVSHYFSQDNVVPPDYHESTENAPAFSKLYSATQFQGEAKTKKHLGFFKSSTKGKSGSLLGRKKQ